MRARFIVMIFLAFSAPAVGFDSVPSLKPIQHNTSEILNELEFTYFQRAMVAIEHKNWDEARGYRAGVQQIAAAGLIDWKLALYDKDSSYVQLALAVQSLEEWPRHIRIRILAEEKIAKSGMNAASIADWFSQWPAISGAGKIAESHAYFALGKPDLAQKILIDAWRNHFLPKETIGEILKTRGELLSPSDHGARVNMLLWQRRATEAQELLPKLDKGVKAVSIARIRLMRRARGIDQALANVPPALQTNPGLLYERALRLRKAGKSKDALALLLLMPAKVENERGQARVWRERHLLARREMKDNNYDTAYLLARANGFERGTYFAEGEWLAGWLALRKLNQPATAQQHFEKLAENVRMPVSKARGYYWLGEALFAQGYEVEAYKQYGKAAIYNFTFYGQLAQEKIEPGYIIFGNDPEPDEWSKLVFNDHPQVQALKLLAVGDDTNTYRRFSYHLDDILPGAVDHVMLARLNRQNGHAGIAVRAAKAALHRNEILPESSWPILSFPQKSNRPEPALILALSRQESEFNPQAVSRVGARGLMQLMPRTAKSTAKAEGLKYKKSWLIDDPAYNLDLGSAHLQELLDKFDGSYILSAAAYNAGVSRANKWIKDYGDPRGMVDPVDWLESIPFSETRNYVQRLMENVQIYRNRISQTPALIQLNRDLNRGNNYWQPIGKQAMYPVLIDPVLQ